MYKYHFKYEDEELNQDCDSLIQALCLAIMDEDAETGEFQKIMNLETGTIFVNKEMFRKIQEDFQLTILAILNKLFFENGSVE